MHLTQKCWGGIRLSPRPQSFGAAADIGLFLLLPAPQFNQGRGPPIFSGAGTFALFSRNDPGSLWRYVAVTSLFLAMGVANALQRPFECARTGIAEGY